MESERKNGFGELLCGERLREREDLVQLVLGLDEAETERVFTLARKLLAPQ